MGLPLPEFVSATAVTAIEPDIECTLALRATSLH